MIDVKMGISGQPSTVRDHQPGPVDRASLSQEQLLDALPEAVLLFDEAERLVGHSPSFTDLFPGLDDLMREQVTADALFAAVTVHLAPAMHQGNSPHLDERLRRFREVSPPWRQFLADGRIVEIEDRPLPDGGRLSSYRDVTRQAVEFSLLSQRLAAIEALGDGVLIAQPDGRIDFINKAMAALLGIERQDASAGLQWLDLLTPESGARIERDVLPALPNIHSWRGEVAGLLPDKGTVPLELSISELEEGGVIAVARSLEEQKAQAAERARLQAQFFGAQKMETLGTLAGGIAHDFNNILASIVGYATFLAEDLKPGGQEAGYAQNILTASERAKSLIGRILAFSRRTNSGDDVFSPADVLRETALFLQSMLPPSVDLIVNLPDRSPVCRGDASQIGQVVMNLAVNARDALPKTGGTISMALSDEFPDSLEPTADTVVIGDRTALKRGEPHQCLSVSDNGSGIDSKTLARIFEPFFTTKGDRGGTGLGLAAAQGIIAEYDGVLVVHSRPGEGTTFSLLLPTPPALS